MPPATGRRRARDGFLASLPAAYRTGAEGVLAELTDDTARAVVNGRCVAADFQLSTLEKRSC